MRGKLGSGRSADNGLGSEWIRRTRRDFFANGARANPRSNPYLLRMTLNLSWVVERLAVGGSFPAERVSDLSSLGIRAVVDAREEARDDAVLLRRYGIDFLHLPAPDRLPLPPSAIHDGVAWTNVRLNRGEKVLVHCEHGIGRSPLLVLCILVSRGMPPLEALATAKNARECVSPSPEQLGAFLAWVRDCAHLSDLPSLDELGRVAYRHLRRTS